MALTTRRPKPAGHGGTDQHHTGPTAPMHPTGQDRGTLINGQPQPSYPPNSPQNPYGQEGPQR